MHHKQLEIEVGKAMVMDDDSDGLSLDISEEDLAIDAGPESTVTWSTDWTVSTLVDQLARERFDLEPAFQRRDVWSIARQSQFIESLLLGIPIPQIILAERKEQRGRFIVLDGKQRLRTLQRFAGLGSAPPLKLTGLKFVPALNGKTYEDLRNNLELDSYLAVLENQAIRAVVLRGWRHETLLYLTFLRLNSNTVGLSPQELRRALHPGPFMDFVIQRSSDSKAIQRFMNLKRPDFRMRDAEILTRHLALSSHLDAYKGNLKSFLDDYCRIANKDWKSSAAGVTISADGLDDAINFTYEIFGTEAFKKATRRGWESRKNRAVLDIMSYYLQYPEVRDELTDQFGTVKDAFRHTCLENGEFSDYLTSTTKSVRAVYGRLEIWGNILRRHAPSVAQYIPS